MTTAFSLFAVGLGPSADALRHSQERSWDFEGTWRLANDVHDMHHAKDKHINVVIAGDRADGLVGLLSSLACTSETPNEIYLWLISNSTRYPDSIEYQVKAFAGITTLSMDQIDQDLFTKGIPPLWRWPEFGSSLVEGWRNGNTIETKDWDHDLKHKSVYNHVRFYLPHLSWFQDVQKLLFIDDDIVFQRDVALLKNVPAAPGVAVVSTCDVWRWTAGFDNGNFQYFNNASVGTSSALYMGTSEDSKATRAKILPVMKSLQHMLEADLEAQLDWNFGVAMIPLVNWREAKMTQLFERWMKANYYLHLVPENSLMFGLGIPQIVFMKHHQCWMEDVYVVEALGTLTPHNHRANGFGVEYLENANALHWAGDNKPWVEGNKLDEEFRLPFTRMMAAVNAMCFNCTKGRRISEMDPASVASLWASVDGIDRVQCKSGFLVRAHA